MGMDKQVLEHLLEQKKEERGVHLDTELSAADWKDLVADFKATIKAELGVRISRRSPGISSGAQSAPYSDPG